METLRRLAATFQSYSGQFDESSNVTSMSFRFPLKLPGLSELLLGSGLLVDFPLLDSGAIEKPAFPGADRRYTAGAQEARDGALMGVEIRGHLCKRQSRVVRQFRTRRGRSLMSSAGLCLGREGRSGRYRRGRRASLVGPSLG